MSVHNFAIQPPVQDSAATSRRRAASSRSATSRLRDASALSEGIATRRFYDLVSAEDAALQDGSVAHGPAYTEPHAPRVGGRRTDADREGSHHGPAGEEKGSAIDADLILLVEAVIHRAAHQAHAGI